MSTIVTRAGKGSALTWTEGDANVTNLNNDKMEKSAPVLAGNLDVATYSITTSTTNGNIVIEPNGTGDLHVITDALRIGDLNTEARISTYGTGDLVLTTNEGNDPDPTITIGNGANANITLTPSGTGSIVLDGLNWPQTDGTADYVLKTNGSGTLSWVAQPSAGATTLDGLTDVVITAAATNDVLVYNGTNWVDTAANTLTVSAASTATTATTATNATNITISTTTGNSNDTTLYPVMVGTNSASSQLPHIDSTGLAFNATTNTLTLGSSGASNAGGLILFGASTANNITIATPSLGGSITLTLPNATGTLLNSNGTLTGVFNGSTVTASSSITPNNTGGANINFGTSGLSASAWTNLGISIRQQARTYTDSSSTGTVAVSAINGFGIPTLGSTNAITVTDAASIYIADGPTAGTNTTITNKWALLTPGNISANRFVSTQATGTAPFTVASTTNVANLNASSLNGATFAAPGAIGGTTKSTAVFTTATIDTAVLDDIRETVFALTYGATITPDAANGSVQTVTLTGNVTFSAFSNPVSGQSITLIITQDGTGSRTLTSTMKFSGASKTLSTAAASIDILTVSYIGTTYYASLSKGFA